MLPFCLLSKLIHHLGKGRIGTFFMPLMSFKDGSFQIDIFNEDGNIFVTDLFETSRRYYLRMMLNENYYVASVDKKRVKRL